MACIFCYMPYVFFEHAKRDVVTPFCVHEFAYQTIQIPIQTEKNAIKNSKYGIFLK